MAVPANILQQVQTYQMSGLGFLQNLACFLGTSNTKFKNFDKLTANLGDTVTFDLPPRFTTTNSLVATFQPADQRVQITINQLQMERNKALQRWDLNPNPFLVNQKIGDFSYANEDDTY